jgi:hypothetical protein
MTAKQIVIPSQERDLRQTEPSPNREPPGKVANESIAAVGRRVQVARWTRFFTNPVAKFYGNISRIRDFEGSAGS